MLVDGKPLALDQVVQTPFASRETPPSQVPNHIWWRWSSSIATSPSPPSPLFAWVYWTHEGPSRRATPSPPNQNAPVWSSRIGAAAATGEGTRSVSQSTEMPAESLRPE